MIDAPDARPRGDPRAEYEARLADRREVVAAAERTESRLANARLLVFVAGVAGAWLLRARVPVPVLLGIVAAAFVGLAWRHGRARARLARARRGVALYQDGLDRLAFRFAGRGPAGRRWRDAAHPYVDHLDIFGEGSLYDLLCGSRTAAGQEALAAWLSAPATAAEIVGRQAAVRELRDSLDLREDLAVLDARVLHAFDSDALVRWASAEPVLRPGPLRWLALLLPAGTLAAGVAAIWIGTPLLAWLLVAELLLWLPLRRRVDAVLAGIDEPAAALRLAREALVRLERERFESPRLVELAARLGDADPPPSDSLGILLRRIDRLEWRGNQIFLPIALALLWGTNGAFGIEAWRARHGASVAGWIAAVGEIEALLDLARFAYERPGYAFPEVDGERPRLDARELAHPLLPEPTPNDVRLDADRPLLMVTGSNMSGKSTLLRTVGANVVLALAGAPVRAKEMRLSPLAVGASIRTVDSLLDGASRFYAEIHAIKRAMDAAEASPPGLFLLDELLHGTNSHDRRIGAEAIVEGFLERGALGIITTHDLALAAIADGLGPRARNAHFAFELEAGEIRFDYTLHPGVVRTGNALEIMRAAGLDV